VLHKVSVIIPTIGRVKLNNAIDSVRFQSGVETEILVIDDSRDQDISFSKSSKIRVLKTGGEVGVSKSRNLGIRNSNNPLIAFLDDDDEWFKLKLTKQIAFMDANGCQASFTGAIVNNKIIRPKRSLSGLTSPINQIYSYTHIFRNKFYAPMGSLIYDRNYHSGFFNERIAERENLMFYEDLWVSKLKIMQMPEALLKVNYSPKDSLNRLNLGTELEWLKFLDNYSNRVKNNFIVESSRNFLRQGMFLDALRMTAKLIEN
jgi:glycosyltransferase involved in cell wall biosynthesis